jgi:hypothetical protein
MMRMWISACVTGVMGEKPVSIFVPSMTNQPLDHGIGAAPAPAGASDFDAVVKQFEDLASKDPLERVRDAVLKAHHLTEDQLAALPAGQRAAIEREIADAVRRTLGAKQAVKADGLSSQQKVSPSAETLAALQA